MFIATQEGADAKLMHEFVVLSKPSPSIPEVGLDGLIGSAESKRSARNCLNGETMTKRSEKQTQLKRECYYDKQGKRSP